MKRSTPATVAAVRPLKFSTLLLAVSLLSGCVERKMSITSEPSGALVYMNGREIGRTPIQTDFTWYGDYDVQVRKEGYQTLKTVTFVKAPVWQWVPLDLVAELMPWHPTDRKNLHYHLEPMPSLDTPSDTLLERAATLQAQVESSHVQK